MSHKAHNRITFTAIKHTLHHLRTFSFFIDFNRITIVQAILEPLLPLVQEVTNVAQSLEVMVEEEVAEEGVAEEEEGDLVGMIQGVSLGMRDVPPVDRVIVEVVVRVIVVVVPPPIVVPEVVVIVVLH